MDKDRAERLDRYLVRTGHAASRRKAREMIEGDGVVLNGRRGKKGDTVSSGDTVEVPAPDNARAIEPDPDAEIEILFEDAALAVVNKRGGCPCHPLRPGERGTVMNAVVARLPETATAGDKPLEGGLVHRLDNGTSGALLIARSAQAFTILRAAIRSGAVKRRYLALVAGTPDTPLTLNLPIAHHPKNPRRMVAAAANPGVLSARPAVTRVETVRRAGKFTLLSVTPSTGARHQIRVHLASAGFPIIGDELYGGGAAAALGPGRFWLHLSQMEFESPASGAVRIEAPLPAELSKMLPKC